MSSCHSSQALARIIKIFLANIATVIMSPRKTHWISSKKQLAELIRPVPYEIRLAMEMLGPCTVSELAEHLGRSAESLYYHIRKLEAVGLIEPSESVVRNRREEIVYRLCADRIRLDLTNRSPSFIDALIKGTRTLIRYADRCLSLALCDSETVLTSQLRECRVVQVSKRLSKDQVKELNAKILELESYLEDIDANSGDKKYLITLVLSPARPSANDE